MKCFFFIVAIALMASSVAAINMRTMMSMRSENMVNTNLHAKLGYGAYPARSEAAARAIVANFPAFQAWQRLNHVSHGGKTLQGKIDPQTGAIQPAKAPAKAKKGKATATSPVTLKATAISSLSEIFWHSGTAIALMGCRDEGVNDLDGWSANSLSMHGRKLLRVEVDAAKKNNAWYVGDGEDAGNNNAATNLVEKIPGYSKYTGSHEFDLWTREANILGLGITKTIRANVDKKSFMKLSFLLNGPNKPAQVINVFQCEDQIHFKHELVNKHTRQCKYAYKKLWNDAGDLHCLCTHKLCSAKVAADPVLKKKCFGEHTWSQVAGMKAKMPEADWVKACAATKGSLLNLPLFATTKAGAAATPKAAVKKGAKPTQSTAKKGATKAKK